MKPSGIGGMAVMEGVMMKNKDEYAIAVRKPDNEIVVEKSIHKDFSNKVKLFKLPIFRGMLAFVDSMVIGIKVLNFSASFIEEEEETDQKDNKKTKKASRSKAKEADFEVLELTITESDDKEVKQAKEDKPKEEQSNALLMLAAVLVSILVSISLFMVLPVVISNLFSRFISTKFVLHLLEGLIRISIFIGYVIAASQMREIKRVFMYHGAEHKTINCLENGFELTVENVKWQSKIHKRCGTSFMLLVMMISLVIFMLLPSLNLPMRILSRVLLVPFIAGVSYEFIRLAGKTESKLVHVLSKPGMWMQGLTTREPEDAMIEVAIRSVETVFDWKGFLETPATEEVKAVNKVKPVKKDEKKQGNTATAAAVNPIRASKAEEEDDEILKALDRYLDFDVSDQAKQAK